jgi:hypothetical protein
LLAKQISLVNIFQGNFSLSFSGPFPNRLWSQRFLVKKFEKLFSNLENIKMFKSSALRNNFELTISRTTLSQKFL